MLAHQVMDDVEQAIRVPAAAVVRANIDVGDGADVDAVVDGGAQADSGMDSKQVDAAQQMAEQGMATVITTTMALARRFGMLGRTRRWGWRGMADRRWRAVSGR